MLINTFSLQHKILTNLESQIIDKPDRLWYIIQVFYSYFSIYLLLIKLSLQYLYSIITEHDTPNPGTI